MIELVEGKTYKIKRIQTAYGSRPRKVVWLDAQFVGIRDGKWYEFALSEDRTISFPAERMQREKCVKEIHGEKDR